MNPRVLWGSVIGCIVLVLVTIVTMLFISPRFAGTTLTPTRPDKITLLPPTPRPPLHFRVRMGPDAGYTGYPAQYTVNVVSDPEGIDCTREYQGTEFINTTGPCETDFQQVRRVTLTASSNDERIVPSANASWTCVGMTDEGTPLIREEVDRSWSIDVETQLGSEFADLVMCYFRFSTGFPLSTPSPTAVPPPP